MKAKITTKGILVLTPESETEDYALEFWRAANRQVFNMENNGPTQSKVLAYFDSAINIDIYNENPL